MKNFLFIGALFVAVAFTSCKKDYTCTCTVSDSSGTLPSVTTSTTINDTKSNAEDTCNNGDASVGTLTTACEIS